MKFPTMDEFAQMVADKAIDEIEYKGKTLRQWVEIISASEHSTNLAEVGTDVPDINVGELISREQAIETFKDCAANGVGIEGIVDALKQLPPASCSEIPNNSDTISRQAAIEALHTILMYRMGTDSNKKRLDDWINSLPPIQPKRGKWIKTARWGRVYYCNQCRNYLDFDGVNAGRGSANFCPNCGAKMEVNHESN